MICFLVNFVGTSHVFQSREKKDLPIFLTLEKMHRLHHLLLSHQNRFTVALQITTDKITQGFELKTVGIHNMIINTDGIYPSMF